MPSGGAVSAHRERVDAALACLRDGRPVLVADDRDREDEVDVVLPAATATTTWVAWTIRHTSGYLCAPLPEHRADHLELPVMVRRTQDPRGTAYTVSVDASGGVGTGISAADRATTLRVLADPTAGPADLIRPGHVLPLRALPGGVLERPGHTEAAVDLCRLAGVGDVAAIAELVEDDGTMTNRARAAVLARRHGLALLTIADLIAYRSAEGRPAVPAPAHTSNRVRARGTARLPTPHGVFDVHAYADLRTGDEHLALTAPGPIHDGGTAARPDPLVRLHSECRRTGDALGSARCDCGEQLRTAMARVAKEGGAVIYLGGHEGRGIGLLPKIAAYALQDAGADTIEANLRLGHPAEAREYGAAAAILTDLTMRRIRLLTNNPAKVTGMTDAGIEVSAALGLDVGHTPHNHRYLETKRTAMNHHLPSLDARMGGTTTPRPAERGTDATEDLS
ncbi:3,4-dihydroxy-2-butanone-4-phosphate synthase [Sanguibacter sp. Z1732]|uniref:3,4-dihydroxy-2-butanone-4-phosphate synthase n=1 Tax=Sanguibacter sp. Z1732 TaxID=3435412 RepID=UPI003D9CB9E4